jgi:hypothetical protein
MKTSQFVELTGSDMEAIRGGLQEGGVRGGRFAG